MAGQEDAYLEPLHLERQPTEEVPERFPEAQGLEP